MSHVYCPECGFQNPETANYCSRCGALLVREELGQETTQSFSAEEAESEATEIVDDLGIRGTALVVRSGGGRSGETFHPTGKRTLIGRSPDCDIFLDDVTVSRRHAVLVENQGRYSIEDFGSLNGTFVNRRRVDTGELSDGDELQIGKYRLVFFQR
jgi:FHA domain/zinc-ribbon domain